MSSAKLVPELLISNHAVSTSMSGSLDSRGVTIGRPRNSPISIAAAPKRPYGRGINLQIEVDKLDPIHARLEEAGIALFRPVEEANRIVLITLPSK